MEQLNLPPRIANSPTPRTDAATNRPRKCYPLVKAELAQQLEREQQWMMEVMELLANHQLHESRNHDPKACRACQNLTAYTELNNYMEDKK